MLSKTFIPTIIIMFTIQWKYNKPRTTFQDTDPTKGIGREVVRGKKGISIIEILVVIAIIGTALVGILSLVVLSLKSSVLIKETTQANVLAQETIEAVRNFRDEIDWNNDDVGDEYDGLGVVSTGVAHHPEKSTDIPPKWMLLEGEETIDGFTRKVVFENVSRDANDDIEMTHNPVNADPDTKKAVFTVSWKGKKVEIVTFFTNWK